MYLRYYLNDNGDRQYTLATIDPSGKPTLSAHPGMALLIVKLLILANVRSSYIPPHTNREKIHARFSPEDKYSRQRITIKKRFGLLLTQQPEPIH